MSDELEADDKAQNLVRHALNDRLIATARAAQKAGKEAQFSVEFPWGLYVRVRKRELAYYVQARGPRGSDEKSTTVKRRVCPVGAKSFAEIKRIAQKAITEIKEGGNVDAALRALLAGEDESAVKIAVDRAVASKAELWTFGQLIDAYVDRRKSAPKADQFQLRPSSIREIMDRLRNRPEAASLMEKYVKALRLDHFEAVKENIREENVDSPTAHAKFVVLSKRILKWGHRHRRLKLGLKPEDSWWNGLSHEHRLGDRSGRMLTPAQVGTLIALVEAVRATEPNTSDAVLGALQCCWIIVQRVDALTEMKALPTMNWVPDPLRKGWIVYTWMSDDVKAGREIKMSVPPIAIGIIDRVATSTEAILSAPSRYAFPQIANKYMIRAAVSAERQRTANAMASRQSAAQAQIQVPAHMDKPITESSLNHALDSLGGHREGSLDVLSMVDLPNKIGPHDLRRSVTHYFDQIGETAYASALLDHKVTGKDKMDREVAAITQGVYSSADRVIFKAEGLVRWMEAVLPEYERAKTDPRIAKAVAARIAHLVKKKREGGRKSALSRATARSVGK